MYLIQGVFFQNYTSLDISFETGESAAVIRTMLSFFVFNGIIGKPVDDPDSSLKGEIKDRFGEAALSEIKIDESTISFVKKYRQRTDSVEYFFRRADHDNLLYEGEYNGPPEVGSGFARCVLVEVPDEFLIPPEKILEKARREFQQRRARETEAALREAGGLTGSDALDPYFRRS